MNESSDLLCLLASRYLKIFAHIFFVLIALSPVARAQETSNDKIKNPANYDAVPIENNDYTARPYYEWMARQALSHGFDNFDFGKFRGYYAKTEEYDPTAQKTLDQLYALAFALEKETDAAKAKKIITDYTALITAHLANIDVVTAAAGLSARDSRLGDTKFFGRMRDGLLQSVLKSGDGENLFRAYSVITLGEETALLKSLPVKILDVKTEQSGGVYYNMHLVSDSAHQKPYTIFVDVTVPMTRMVVD